MFIGMNEMDVDAQEEWEVWTGQWSAFQEELEHQREIARIQKDWIAEEEIDKQETALQEWLAQ